MCNEVISITDYTQTKIIDFEDFTVVEAVASGDITIKKGDVTNLKIFQVESYPLRIFLE